MCLPWQAHLSEEEVKAATILVKSTSPGTDGVTVRLLEACWPGIKDLGKRLGIRFQAITPWYGWRWALRPWIARLKRRREPSRFAILLAKKSY